MKRTMSLCLIALLLALLPSVALGEGALPLAAPVVDQKQFERYAAYQYDEASGDWFVRGNGAELAMQQIAAEGPRGICYFDLELYGNARTGLVMPELTVYYVDTQAMNASAISLVVGGTRYDLRVTSEAINIGGRRAEKLRAPMLSNGLDMLRAMAEAGSISIRLHGEQRASATIALKATYRNSAEQLQAASIGDVKQMLSELDAIGIGGYHLWDMNAARWKLETGKAPRMDAVALQPDAAAPVALLPAFDMLYRGDNGAAVTNLNDRLKKQGFLYQRTASATYGDATFAAVAMAQNYYGMLPTGAADRPFVEKLFSDDQSPVSAAPTEAPASAIASTGVTQADSGVTYDMGGAAEVSLDRYWLAGSVVTSRPAADGTSERAGANLDDLLLIADGRIRNTRAAELGLYFQMTGVLTIGDTYQFPCTLATEGDNGSRFDNTLLPLGESRLVVYAEMPASALKADGAWAVKLTIGDVTLVYPLAK